MLTKFILYYDNFSQQYELQPDDLKNWDEIKCCYKRSEYSGITRSFTSEFVFVNRAYELVMALYLQDGFNAQATISLYTMNDNWGWDEQFSAPIDFSSLKWDSYTLKANCLDNSLAALIKARKGTKYEFVVGEDIVSNSVLQYDRLKMINSCTHQIMGNGTDSWYGDYVDLYPTKKKRLPTYVVGDAETYENSPILHGDQTEDAGSCFIECVKSISELEIDIVVETNGHTGLSDVVNNVNIYLSQFTKGTNTETSKTIFHYKSNDTSRQYVGAFASYEALLKRYPKPTANMWALIGTSKQDASAVYVATVSDSPEWVKGQLIIRGGRQTREYDTETVVYKTTLKYTNLSVGQCFALLYECDITNPHGSARQQFLAVKSSIKTRWISRANTIGIDAIRPVDALSALVGRISDNQFNIHAYIDNSDTRIEKTYILAAESVRGISGAKFYSTFQEFCDWMSAVFGYTYYLGEPEKSLFVGVEPFDGPWTASEGSLVDEMCPLNNIADLSFMNGYNVFAVFNNNNGKFYTKWPKTSRFEGWEEYNNPDGTARTDKVYVENYSGQAYRVDGIGGLVVYVGDVTTCAKDSQSIYFVHRSSLFDNSKIIDVEGATELSYSIPKDFVISTILAGYEKHDYETICGRDEWNFTNQYNTGVDLAEKKLELISKYRSDCYGLEFLSQKRGKDSTSDSGDNTVFFVHCKTENETVDDTDAESISRSKLVLDRSVNIVGAYSDTVFNGEYSPIECLKANEGYLSAIKRGALLKFTSSEGNTDIVINGVACNSDVQLASQLFTAGELDFTIGSVEYPIDYTAIYRVKIDGITYYGYLLETTTYYSRNEATNYKLIVKDIELC